MDASDEAIQAFACRKGQILKARVQSSGQYAKVANHAEPVCLNVAPCTDIGMQIELFKDALDALDADPELINQVPGP